MCVCVTTAEASVPDRAPIHVYWDICEAKISTEWKEKGRRQMTINFSVSNPFFIIIFGSADTRGSSMYRWTGSHADVARSRVPPPIYTHTHTFISRNIKYRHKVCVCVCSGRPGSVTSAFVIVITIKASRNIPTRGRTCRLYCIHKQWWCLFCIVWILYYPEGRAIGGRFECRVGGRPPVICVENYGVHTRARARANPNNNNNI